MNIREKQKIYIHFSTLFSNSSFRDHVFSSGITVQKGCMKMEETRIGVRQGGIPTYICGGPFGIECSFKSFASSVLASLTSLLLDFYKTLTKSQMIHGKSFFLESFPFEFYHFWHIQAEIQFKSYIPIKIINDRFI